MTIYSTRTSRSGIHKRVTPEDRATMIRLANEGKSRKEIAEALPQYHYQTVNNYLRRLFLECEIDEVPKTITAQRFEIPTVSDEAKAYRLQESV